MSPISSMIRRMRGTKYGRFAAGCSQGWLLTLALKVIVAALSLSTGFSLIPQLQAEAAVLFSSTNRRELSVGDRIFFTVNTIVPKGATVIPPDPAGSFGPVTVKEWSSKKHELANVDSVVFDYALTTYKAENCTIPQLSYIMENGTARDTLKTESIPLTVIPVCGIDSADIMDLRPQQVTGRPPLLWLWLLTGALIAAAGAWVVRYYIRKLRKPPPPPPPKPPYEEAIESLEALAAKQYIAKGMIREYVFELSEILKRYIERRFAVNAAEFTTEEMLAWLGISPIDTSLGNSLEWFFRNTDPVKFAKYLPDQVTIERFGTEARSFIDATRPQQEKEKKEAAGASGQAPAAAVRSSQKGTGVGA